MGEPGYLQTERVSLFTLRHAPSPPCRGLILQLPAFTEELNTCRRVCAQAARRFAEQGWMVWQFDPTGCGDSGGDQRQTCWQDWVSDAQQVLQHALHDPQVPAHTPVWLWGVRAGALMSADLLSKVQDWAGPRPVHLLWWQPQLLGKQILQQWLRVDSAQAWLGQAPQGSSPASAQLAQGRAVCVGGYTLTPELAADLAAPRSPPTPPQPAPARLVWLDVQPSDTPSPASERQLEAWRAAGWLTTWSAAQAPLFWQAPGRENAPELAELSLAQLEATC